MAVGTDPSMRFVLPEGSPLPGNLAALWAIDPPTALRIEEALESDAYPLEPTRSGLPTVSVPGPDGRRTLLHSRYQPLEEAKRLVASAGVDEHVVFCVHGFGLGYHVAELFEQAGDEALVLVMEPDLRLLRTALEARNYADMLATGRVILVTDPDRGRLVSRLNGHQPLFLGGLSFVPHGPSLQLHPDFHRQMQQCMGEFVALCRTGLNTAILNGQRTCENLARNILYYAAAPGIGRLRGRHAGRPAIIVSAGPSLRKNQRLLRQAAGRAVIIAVQTMLRPLLELGVRPDYVTSIDYHGISAQFFEGVEADGHTELVIDPKASTAVMNAWRGRMSVLGNAFADALLHEMPQEKPRLRDGATVAHTSFYLAEYLACDPLIFVGQDLGFGDGLCYLPGTSHEEVWRPELGRFCTVEMKQWEHIVRERAILRRIEDQQGRPMYTEERLFAYLQQFERDFAASRARIIDATEGGARKHGAQAMSLAEALDTYCAAPLPLVPDDHPGQCAGLAGRCAGSLRARRDEARRIEQIAADTLPLLEEVRDHLADQARVNRAIARIDALRLKMRQLDHCYELITQLTQFTEVMRFRSDRMIAAARLTGIERQRRQVERDIANVRGIIDAARVFQRLMDEVADSLEGRA